MFPALGLLRELVAGEVAPEMAGVLSLISRFKAGLGALRAEHSRIRYAIDALLDAARKEGNGEYAQFAYRSMVHQMIEEEVIYPAVLLIGEHIRQKLNT